MNSNNQDEASSCAICLTEFGGMQGKEGGEGIKTATTTHARLPCCEVEGCSTIFCIRCIELVCENSPNNVGRCPRCRTQSIQVVNGVVQKIEKAKAQCRMCRQQHFIKAGGLCEGCFEGNRNSLRYRCDGCNRVQTIPHPMYRYQPSPTASGVPTWACYQRCGDQTRWCIIPEDLDKIPMGEAPEAWGLHDNFLEQIRAIRRQEMMRRTS